MSVNEVSGLVIGAAIEVHRHLGPGLLEGAYGEALAHELALGGVSFTRQTEIPASYKGQSLPVSYRADFIVEALVVVELKSIDRLAGVHGSQVLTYLRLTGLSLGLLINFNVPLLRSGIQRIANNAPNLPRSP